MTEHPPALPAVLEALLLVTDEPVPADVLARVAEQPPAEVERVLHALAAGYAAEGRGFELRQAGAGWRLYTSPACAPYVERLVREDTTARLTKAALETLAIVAYKQPVTRARIAAVRGVEVDGVVRTLLARGLVTEAGPEDGSTAARYVTTPLMLERLGLRSLDELPSLAPLVPDLDALDDLDGLDETHDLEHRGPA